MTIIRRKMVIKAPVENVYNYIDDPTNSPKWLRNLIEVKDVIGEGFGSRHNWTWKMGGIHLKGQTTNIDDVPDERILLKNIWGIRNLWSLLFQPHKKATTLELDIDYKITYSTARENSRTGVPESK